MGLGRSRTPGPAQPVSRGLPATPLAQAGRREAVPAQLDQRLVKLRGRGISNERDAAPWHVERRRVPDQGPSASSRSALTPPSKHGPEA